MMNLKVNIVSVFMLVLATYTYGQDTSKAKTDNLKYKHSLGASLFMLGNVLAEESPDYYLLTYGYRLNKMDRIFAEFNTWKYAEPLGTYGKSKAFYPGFVRAWGLGMGYQCFIWKGAFVTAQGTAFMKQYVDDSGEKIQKGTQLYLQAAAGYRVEFMKNRWYIEPAIALKYWPVDTNFPADFAKIEKGAPNYIFEPSLNCGIRF